VAQNMFVSHSPLGQLAKLIVYNVIKQTTLNITIYYYYSVPKPMLIYPSVKKMKYITLLQRMSSSQSSTKLFVVFPPTAASDYVIFGVNSVRPMDEVQDVVYLPAAESAADTTVKVCFMLFANMPVGVGM